VNLSPRVLVIDGSSDTETVLKAVLEPRGTSVGRRRNHRFDSRFEASLTPAVVVIDLDAEPDALRNGSPWQNSARVLLGSHRPPSRAHGERFLAKPFHYPELVRLIEELLDENAAA
jgi:chemotaxis response regulator CheB